MSEHDLSSAPHAGAPLSLLSLSIAAANAEPIEVPQDPTVDVDDHNSWRGASVESTHHSRNPSQGVAVHNGTKHRRLSSAGQVRRRLSDARDAANRPSPAALQSAMTTLNSLASLSISSSVSPPGLDITSAVTRTPTVPVAIPVLNTAARNGISSSAPADEGSGISCTPPLADSKAGVTGITTRNGKKRGTTFTCESCSKVYRHPSCLIKHRWEHTPYWREASKFLLSKHQQVQLMEAAAILSHLTPSASGGSSLPDDRSLWPSFLSGGALPPPIPTGETVAETTAYPTSSSVPSGRPRIHDYALPSTSVSGITRLRPGIIAVPTDPTSYAQPESGAAQSYTTGCGSAGVESASFASSYQSSSVGVIVPHGRASGSSDRWSRSLSLSHSGSSDESEFVEVDAETTPSGGFSMRRLHSGDEGAVGVKEEEEEDDGWDGMEMEMEL